jgi:uncharacterized protein YndB with AHSA1/START domain
VKWILIGAAAIAFLIALMALIGSRLPKGHVATVRARHKQPPDVLWAAVTNLPDLANWRSDLKSVEIVAAEDGRPVWVEHGRSGNIRMRIEREEPPQRLVVRIADPKLPFGGSWNYVFEPTGDGTLLHITEDGEVYNPLFRFMQRVIFGPYGTLERYQRDLGRKFGDTVVPERVR